MKPARNKSSRKRAAKSQGPPSGSGEAPDILQFRIWLKDVSPMVWRRVQVPATMTLHELHGVFQVAMGWEGIHLYQFILYAVRYGSWETAARSPDIQLGDLKLRKGSRFIYEYDLNIPWEHEVRLEDRFAAKRETAYPCCNGGDGSCPPEDCGGPEAFIMQTDYVFEPEMYDDLALAANFMEEACRTKSFAAIDDPDRAEELREALGRIEVRASMLGVPFSRKAVNRRLHDGEHLVLMHQQI